MIFAPPRISQRLFNDYKDFDLYYDNFKIERVKVTKFLGVHLEQTLNWSHHISEISKKLSKINGVLFNLSKSTPPKLLTSIYHALVGAHLNYCITIWGAGGDDNKLSKLFIAQKHAIRTIFKVKRESKFVPGHTKCAFKDNSVLTVHNMYTLNILVETFKLLNHDNQPKFLLHNLTKSNFSHRLIPPISVYTDLSKNFLYSSVKLWNTLDNIKMLSKIDNISLPLFRTVIKKFLFRLQEYGNEEEWLPHNTDFQVHHSCIGDYIKDTVSLL